MPKTMLRHAAVIGASVLFSLLARPAGAQISILPSPATPEMATDVSVAWEVKNRFRLFRDEKDFQRHIAAQQMGSVLAAEQLLARESDGRGWARDTVARLCIDGIGRVVDTCVRDGVRESYLTPADHRIAVHLAGQVEAGSACAWSFDDGQGKPQSFNLDCREDVKLRVRFGRPTMATVDMTPPGGTPRRALAEILVRDLLIAGMGDSVAAGEGNPDRPVALSDDGFCFRNFGGYEYFRPGRVGYKGDKACEGARGSESDNTEWSRLSARWLSAACHRSLYSYQVRTALALAVENPHFAVTFIPLACTGATTDYGLFTAQRARELNCGASNNASCPRSIPSQTEQLTEILIAAQRTQPTRALDLLLLTVGANDVNFSGLVANVIISSSAERTIFRRGGIVSTVDAAQAALNRKLLGDFARLRAGLKPLVGGLNKVIYVTYGNPARAPGGGSCPTSRDGFDVHPAFGIDGERLRATEVFVREQFLPTMKALATCTSGVICAENERMTIAEAHQPAFAEHGLCARSENDPDFDRECFSAEGKSFATSPVEGASEPLVCGRRPSDFRTYASRARWMRTANDSYFAAMTFPEGVSQVLQPSDLHDATWGILSAVYGGAVHPTAEGQAAMADAALAEARVILGLGRPQGTITVAPLAAPDTAGAGGAAPEQR